MKAGKALGALALALASAAAAPAFAQASAPAASHIYLGGTFGQGHWRPGCPDSAICDDTDRALRVLGGYQIDRTFAAEVGFHNFGSVSSPGTRIKANAWEAVLKAAWPIAGSLSVYGKLGGYRGNAEGSGSLLGRRETNYGGTWGLGLQAELTPNLALRGEWQSYSSIAGGTLGPRSDINVISAGALWRFR